MEQENRQRNIPPNVEAILNDVYNLVKKIYEVGVRDGVDLANLTWIEKLNEVNDPESFVKLVKEQRK